MVSNVLIWLLIFSNSIIILYVLYKYVYGKYCVKNDVDPFDDVYYQKLVPDSIGNNINLSNGNMIFP